jgi:plasmid replication initiation protein
MKKAKKSSNSRKLVPVRTIAVSNDLLRMQVVMTPEEINAFFYVITKINPNTAPGQPMIVRFNIKDFVDTMRGIGYDYKNKKRLFESFRSLQRKTSGIMFNDGEKIWLVSVFNDICPDDNHGGIIVKIDDLLGPHLLQLKNNFAVLDFDNVARLKTRSAKVLYLYLKHGGGCPTANRPFVKPWEHEMGTMELKELFGLGVDDYTAIDKKTGKRHFIRAQFEKRVLKPAIKEINGKDKNGKGNTDMIVEWYKEKRCVIRDGVYTKKVDGYVFTVKPRANGSKTAPKKDYEQLNFFDKEVATTGGAQCLPEDREEIDEAIRQEKRDEAEEQFRIWSDTAEGLRCTPQEAEEIEKSMEEKPSKADDENPKK